MFRVQGHCSVSLRTSPLLSPSNRSTLLCPLPSNHVCCSYQELLKKKGLSVVNGSSEVTVRCSLENIIQQRNLVLKAVKNVTSIMINSSNSWKWMVPFFEYASSHAWVSFTDNTRIWIVSLDSYPCFLPPAHTQPSRTDMDSHGWKTCPIQYKYIEPYLGIEPCRPALRGLFGSECGCTAAMVSLLKRGSTPENAPWRMAASRVRGRAMLCLPADETIKSWLKCTILKVQRWTRLNVALSADVWSRIVPLIAIGCNERRKQKECRRERIMATFLCLEL